MFGDRRVVFLSGSKPYEKPLIVAKSLNRPNLGNRTILHHLIEY